MFKVDKRWSEHQVDLIVRFAERGGIEKEAIAHVEIYMGNGPLGFVRLHDSRRFRVQTSEVSEVKAS